MKKIVLAAAVLAAIAFGLAGATHAGNVSSYDGASWYGKYLAVSSGAVPLCSGNSGSVKQPNFGSNVDASHECGTQSETFIAISSAQPKNVIAGSNEIQRLPMRAMYSTNGGSSFTGVDLPLPPPLTNNGFDFGSDPGIAFDAHGNAYYSYIVVFFGSGGGINGTEMAVARSTDSGKSWTATYFAPQTGSGQFNDKPMITVDRTRTPNRVYVAWDNATGNSSSTKNGNNVVISHSDDGGVTFSDPVSVSGPFTGKTGGIGADPYVTSDGTLHVAWQDYAHSRISDAASSDGGLTFSPPLTVATVSGFQTNPVAQASRGALVYPACGALGSALYCSYMNDNKVYVARNSGSGWTSTQMPAAGDQFNQWLAVDPSDGSVNVAYYDTGTPGAPTTTYTLARSTDGGAHYTTSPIATATTDETTPDAELGNQYGDYEGIAALNGIVRPVWTDRRQAVADLGLREEVFTATLKP
jgi:hypothetical protein